MDADTIKYLFYTEGKIDSPFFGGFPEELKDEVNLDFNKLLEDQEFEHKGTSYRITKTHTWKDESPIVVKGMFVLCERID